MISEQRRVLRSDDDVRLRVLAPGLAEHPDDLAHRGVGLDGIQDPRHKQVLPSRVLPQGRPAEAEKDPPCGVVGKATESTPITAGGR